MKQEYTSIYKEAISYLNKDYQSSYEVQVDKYQDGNYWIGILPSNSKLHPILISDKEDTQKLNIPDTVVLRDYDKEINKFVDELVRKKFIKILNNKFQGNRIAKVLKK